jgi:hypothetical protein
MIAECRYGLGTHPRMGATGDFKAAKGILAAPYSCTKCHQRTMHLLDSFSTYCLGNVRQLFRVRYFIQPHTHNLTIGQVQTHLVLQPG